MECLFSSCSGAGGDGGGGDGGGGSSGSSGDSNSRSSSSSRMFEFVCPGGVMVSAAIRPVHVQAFN